MQMHTNIFRTENVFNERYVSLRRRNDCVTSYVSSIFRTFFEYVHRLHRYLLEYHFRAAAKNADRSLLRITSFARKIVGEHLSSSRKIDLGARLPRA